ncbi:MAG: sigma-54-dependent Fis family transcriptional regulator [Candidatus Eisenbacteria bacterium]|nr:sigma-54-dependent Fis family transcriptional regulator [Candidatus Eisenbacteria bacterium]
MRLRGLLAVEKITTRKRLARMLSRHDVEAVPVFHERDFETRLSLEDFDLAIVHQAMFGKRLEALVRSIRQLPNRPDVIVLAENEDASSRASWMAAGALAVLGLGLEDEPLEEALDAFILRKREERLRPFRVDRPDKRYRLDEFAIVSPAMKRFIEMVRRIVSSESPLLIVGETGVGKERLARATHAEGPRANGPFIAVNCAALPENLLESELFGHEQGAFTGATRQRRGYFELAHKGTIFLDEIGDLPVHLQAKLLRVLEDRIVQRLGGERPISVDVRLMAAANRDLEAEMQAGAFRPDLYYRLAVVTLTIPPLRERHEDIGPLAEHFLRYFGAHLGRPVKSIQPNALAALHRHQWPGNVRELINVIERAVLICSGSEITLADLPKAITEQKAIDPERKPLDSSHSDVWSRRDLGWQRRPLVEARRDMLVSFERAYLTHLLNETGGRIGETARLAGINARSLYDLMRRHGLRKEDFRGARGGRPNRAGVAENGAASGEEPR